MRNYIELGIHLNLHNFLVHAGLENGAYAWARAGVPLDVLNSRSNIRHRYLVQELKNKLLILNGYISDDAYQEAITLAELNDPYDINTIANLPCVVPENIIDIMRSTFEDVEDQVSCIEDVQEFCKRHRVDFTLGRYLLNEVSYNGCINFFDPRTMCSLEKYFGGFKTIALTDVDAEFDSLRVGVGATSQVQKPLGFQRFDHNN